MARIRTSAALAGSFLVLGAFVAGPARADAPEVYLGNAAGRALDVSILGQHATFGVATAKVASDLTAKADGAGQLAAGVVSFTGNTSAATTGSGTDAKPSTCGTPTIPGAGDAIKTVLDLGLACSSASTSVVNNLPIAKSTASVGNATLSANTVLNGALAPVTTPLASAVSDLLSQVASATAGSPVKVDPVTTTLNDLVQSVIKTPTLTVSVGESTSGVTANGSTITSLGTANAATIKLLPLPQVSGVASTDPVVTIQVSSASAKAVYDRSTGVATPSFEPAIVTISFNSALTQALAVSQIKVAPDDIPKLASALPGNAAASTCSDDASSICILEGTALESRIRIANGTTVRNPDGSVSAVADGVRLDMLRGINGGIVLDLAHAEAGVGGKPAAKSVPAPAVELPRTGGTPWIPVAAVSVLGLAILIRRAGVRAGNN